VVAVIRVNGAGFVFQRDAGTEQKIDPARYSFLRQIAEAKYRMIEIAAMRFGFG